MKYPLQPGDLQELEHQALVRQFHEKLDQLGYGWAKQFVFPIWAMRRTLEE